MNSDLTVQTEVAFQKTPTCIWFGPSHESGPNPNWKRSASIWLGLFTQKISDHIWSKRSDLGHFGVQCERSQKLHLLKPSSRSAIPSYIALVFTNQAAAWQAPTNSNHIQTAAGWMGLLTCVCQWHEVTCEEAGERSSQPTRSSWPTVIHLAPAERETGSLMVNCT